MSISLRVFAVAVALLSAPGIVVAYPYELYARYKLIDGGKTVTVPLDPEKGRLIPWDPKNAVVEGIFFQAKTDPLAKSALSRLETIVVKVCPGPFCEKPKVLSAVDFQTAKPEPIPLVVPEFLVQGRSVAQVTIEVFPKFTADYLCDQERRLRDDRAKAAFLPPAPPPKAKGSAAPADLDPASRAVLKTGDGGRVWAYSMLFSRALVTADSDSPIVFSFCPSVHEAIDWVQLAKSLRPQVDDPAGDGIREDQKSKLAKLVAARIKRETGEEVVGLKLQNEPRENLYTHLEHSVLLLQSTAEFTIEESGRDKPVEERIDKASPIVLRLKSGSAFCSELPQCNTRFPSSFSSRITYLDEKGNVVNRDGMLRGEGNAWEIAPNMEKNIGSKLTITVSFVSGGDRLDILTERTQVENIGIITTFPVVTEVAAAVTNTRANPSDLTSQSSVPVSWAVNLSHSEASHAAVTFPWMIGFNTRSNPRLADAVKFFPHVSVIFPLASDTRMKSAQVAFGAGIALANAFTFSIATTVKDSPQAFFLVGVSAPDLVKVFRD